MFEKLIGDMEYPEFFIKVVLQLLVVWFTWGVIRDNGISYLKKSKDSSLSPLWFYCQLFIVAVIISQIYLWLCIFTANLLFNSNYF